MIPAFHENWFDTPSQNALAGLVQQAPPGLIIEVGAWEGRSTVAIAHAANPRLVHSIDTWAGSPAEISESIAARRDVHAQWVANVEYWTVGNVVEHRTDWRDYRPDGPVALLFIDAEHTYTEVHDCIEAFLPYMVGGGVVCGDDAHHPPVMEAVHELLAPVTLQATLWVWRKP